MKHLGERHIPLGEVRISLPQHLQQRVWGAQEMGAAETGLCRELVVVVDPRRGGALSPAGVTAVSAGKKGVTGSWRRESARLSGV